MTDAIAQSGTSQTTTVELRFAAPILSKYRWPLLKLESGKPGARLCVMAGMHVNEVSSMEAALRLARLLDGRLVSGSVEIMPVVNVPALWRRVEQICPEDGRNLNFAFPGKEAEGFTAALAAALLHEWAGEADLLIDLHGGDMQTQVAHFVMCQMTGDETFDATTLRYARCFDADAIVAFTAGQTENSGRACNARPLLGRHAVMAEGGGNALIVEDDVRYHVDGVLNCARLLGLIEGTLSPAERARVPLQGVRRVAVPDNGRFYALAGVMQEVEQGEPIGRLLDIYGREIALLEAPCSGPIVFRYSHPIVAANEVVLGIGIRSPAAGKS